MNPAERELSPAALFLIGLILAGLGLLAVGEALSRRRRHRNAAVREVGVDDIFDNPRPEPSYWEQYERDARDPGAWFLILVGGSVAVLAGAGALFRAVLEALR
ncbi:hypothetical protein [Catellatospora citrea]|uniref:Uncharacterized protein n=1 Tax=Catellatospora citrea TaxID=53366 RepID=A0A8J3P4A4_9ACTN|nr:hypothetical protein [Catellatospora citrea]RKE08356.1 hypothetical protein C8E86_3206 [Catellatospora citrea]GIG03169.1 hypothetical protein Cci01nite_82620 [Catellatospora citrea]